MIPASRVVVRNGYVFPQDAFYCFRLRRALAAECRRRSLSPKLDYGTAQSFLTTGGEANDKVDVVCVLFVYAITSLNDAMKDFI